MAMDSDFARRTMWTVWPAFLVAGAAEGLFFTIFDPFDLHFFGAPLEFSRLAIYTMGFFGFWGLGIAASALTLWLERTSRERGEADRAALEEDDGNAAAAKGRPR